MKKLLSICLAVLVVVGLMPVYALADDGDPIGDPTGGPDMTVYTVNAAATGGSISISSATPDAVTGAGPWTVAAGTVINVTATADEGYESVPTTLTATMGGQTTDITGPFAVSGNVSIHATFEKKETNEIVTGAPEPRVTTHTVNISTPNNGSIEVKVDGNTISNGTLVEEGKTLSITTTSEVGYELDQLTVDGAVKEGNTYKMGTGDVTVSATFKAAQSNDAPSAPAAGPHTVQASASPTEGGSVTGIPAGGTVNDNDPLTLTAAANSGYRFKEWTTVTMGGTPVDGTAGSTNKSITINNVTGAVVATAAFVKTHAVSLPSNPANGKVEVTGLNADGTADDGKQITVTATPDANYEVEQFNVTMGGTEQGSGNSRTISSVTGDVTVTVSFKAKAPTPVVTHKVTIKAPENGKITVTYTDKDGNAGKTATSGSVDIKDGTNINVTTTPDTNYKLKTLTIGGANYTADQTNVAVTADIAVSASFEYDGSSASTPSYVYRPIGVYDDDGDWLEDNSGSSFPRPSSDGKVVLDGVLPNQTFYIKLGDAGNDYVTELSGGGKARASQLVDDNLFKISVDKDGDGKSLISKIEQVEEKRLGGMTRASYLKVTLKDMTSTDERKANAEIEFKAKKDKDGSWKKGETAILNLNMWISNKKVSGSDGDADTGEKIYFSPEANENNVLIWGDDRAALEFTADDDAKDFYARLSTKSMSDIYSEYGDPVDADLWFYDFVGNPSIPSTSRAYLTLGIPWDDDDDYTPNPHDVYIYRLDKDGYLEDVTAMFTYSEDDREIEGWTTRTRTLGTYIVSDTELDIDSYYDDDDDTEVPSIDVSNNQKPVPNTGR